MNYWIFVLGFDLLQEKLKKYELPCDIAFSACQDIYNEFLESEEVEQEKSEYDCLQEWINNHSGTIDYIIEMVSR